MMPGEPVGLQPSASGGLGSYQQVNLRETSKRREYNKPPNRKIHYAHDESKYDGTGCGKRGSRFRFAEIGGGRRRGASRVQKIFAECSETGRPYRSEERRVGKEGRSRWSPYHQKKTT